MDVLCDIENDMVDILVDPGVNQDTREIDALRILTRVMNDDSVYRVLHDNPSGNHRSLSSYVIVIVAIMTGREIFNEIGMQVDGIALQAILESIGIAGFA